MVRAESVTVTLVYTYNANGLRVAQSVNGTETPFVWDWASGLPEMLSDGDNLYLVGHDTLGQFASEEWAYYLSDALGSIRQETDDTGAVTGNREWTPFGVEMGAAQSGLGYTGEWLDSYTEFNYLRARWYDGVTGRFTQIDPRSGNHQQPLTMNPYLYALANPILLTDPNGEQAGPEPREPYIHEIRASTVEQIAHEFSVPPIILGAALEHQGARMGYSHWFRGDVLLAIDEYVCDIPTALLLYPGLAQTAYPLFKGDTHSYGIGQVRVGMAHYLGDPALHWHRWNEEFYQATPFDLWWNTKLNIRVMAAQLVDVRFNAENPPPSYNVLRPLLPLSTLDLYILYSIAQNHSRPYNVQRLVEDYYNYGISPDSQLFDSYSRAEQSRAILRAIHELQNLEWIKKNWPLDPGVDLDKWERLLPPGQ
jgi:RHS repeat-associated protein